MVARDFCIRLYAMHCNDVWIFCLCQNPGQNERQPTNASFLNNFPEEIVQLQIKLVEWRKISFQLMKSRTRKFGFIILQLKLQRAVFSSCIFLYSISKSFSLCYRLIQILLTFYIRKGIFITHNQSPSGYYLKI